jgi:hypothetical protein
MRGVKMGSMEPVETELAVGNRVLRIRDRATSMPLPLFTSTGRLGHASISRSGKKWRGGKASESSHSIGQVTED